MLTAYRARLGTEAPDYLFFQNLGVCPNGFVSEFSVEAWNLYQATEGLGRLSEPAQFYRQKALWVHVCRILGSEIAKATDVRRKMDEGVERQRAARDR